ncbi:hypothetical protein LCGC14_0859840 [marine sediment metagenome]|uniref:Uncharacterized protein n=1 Tax=marine sediment metagenome TaxID=412755 RepID=A0A0F9PCP0_9ZZZZ
MTLEGPHQRKALDQGGDARWPDETSAPRFSCWRRRMVTPEELAVWGTDNSSVPPAALTLEVLDEMLLKGLRQQLRQPCLRYDHRFGLLPFSFVRRGKGVT